MTDREVLARQYRDERNLEARQHLWDVSRSEPELDFNHWSVDLVGAGPGDLVLDAGCGNGRPLALLGDTGCTAVGLDLSPGMAATTGHPSIVVGDVQRLPFPDGTFDAAVALMMLYHVPDVSRASSELRRVVRRGGVVVATTASVENNLELCDLVESAVGSGWTWNRPSALHFNLEHGAAALAGAFDAVEVVRAPERRISITDADAAAAYVASTADQSGVGVPAGRSWDDVVESVRSAVHAEVARHGAFVTVARLGALVCR